MNISSLGIRLTKHIVWLIMTNSVGSLIWELLVLYPFHYITRLNITDVFPFLHTVTSSPVQNEFHKVTCPCYTTAPGPRQVQRLLRPGLGSEGNRYRFTLEMTFSQKEVMMMISAVGPSPWQLLVQHLV